MFLFDEIFLEDVSFWLTYIFGEDSNLTRHAEENCGGRNTTLARRSCVRLNRCTPGGVFSWEGSTKKESSAGFSTTFGVMA